MEFNLTITPSPEAVSPTPASTTIVLPETYKQYREETSAEDKAVLAVIAASGKPLGAYYAKDDSGEFTLRKQGSVNHAATPDFASTATFDESNGNYIAVKDANGEMKGFFVVAQRDLTQYAPEFYDAQKFVENYLTPPPEMQKALQNLAAAVAEEYAPHLYPPSQAAEKTPQERNAFLHKLSNLLDETYTAGALLPDDQIGHTHGVATLSTLTALAVNEAAKDHYGDKLYDKTLQETMYLTGLLHDLGKVQIPQRVNSHSLDLLVTDEDKARSPEEQKAIHTAKLRNFMEVNYIHPLITDMVLTLESPAVAQAAAEHHLGLYRDVKTSQELGDHEKKYGLLHDQSDCGNVPFLSQILRVADVADSMHSHGNNKEPAQILHDLYELRNETKPCGLPSIDPDILTFMIDRGVFDRYFKANAPIVLEEEGRIIAGASQWSKLSDEQKAAFQAEKDRILEDHHYAENKGRIENRILDTLSRDPVVAEHREAVERMGDTSFQDAAAGKDTGILRQLYPQAFAQDEQRQRA